MWEVSEKKKTVVLAEPNEIALSLRKASLYYARDGIPESVCVHSMTSRIA